MTRSEYLTSRTIRLIEQGRTIFVRRDDGLYLGQWTQIAAGPDMAHWSRNPARALEMFNLEWAFAIAKLYNCQVVTHKGLR